MVAVRIALVLLLATTPGWPSLAAANDELSTARDVGSPDLHAEWRIDLAARGITSFELADSMHTRDGVVPALGGRVLRRVGRLLLGGSFGAGMPAWYGKAELAASVDIEQVLAQPSCTLITAGPDDIGRRECRGYRWSIDTGLDAGIGLFYFDAPPMLEAPGDELLYWGPLARARVQLHVLSPLASGRALGFVAGIAAAVTSAHYMSTQDTGVRVDM